MMALHSDIYSGCGVLKDAGADVHLFDIGNALTHTRRCRRRGRRTVVLRLREGSTYTFSQPSISGV
jgi:hypothetical protein